MAENRYVKLNANWMETSEWLIVLSAEARLAWVQLLCYVKAHGIAGRVKAKSVVVFARQNFIGEESVEQMIRAAKADGALEIDGGEWVLTGWQQHQSDSTNAERQQRFRDKQKETVEPKDNASNALRNTEEKRGEERRREDSNPPTNVGPLKGGSKRGSRPADIGEVKAYGSEIGLPPDECTDFCEHFENNGWKQGGKTPMKDWKLACNRWKRTWLKANPGKKPPSNDPDPDRSSPREGLDYRMAYDKSVDAIRRFNLNDESPFDESAWKRKRGLHVA